MGTSFFFFALKMSRVLLFSWITAIKEGKIILFKNYSISKVIDGVVDGKRGNNTWWTSPVLLLLINIDSYIFLICL